MPSLALDGLARCLEGTRALEGLTVRSLGTAVSKSVNPLRGGRLAKGWQGPTMGHTETPKADGSGL